MESAQNKSERLAQLEQLLIANPQGLKKAEIARRLGVNRSTIGRYIDELSGRHDSPVPIYDDDGLIKINRDKYLNYIGLTIHEAMAVHLATRLMATRTDKHNRHAAAALRKLGQALDTFAPLISRHVTASANTIDDAARRQDENYMRTLEILTRAWSDRQMVRIWHRYEEGGRVYDYEFAPYFIEPYAVGQTTHAIGWRTPPGKLRTFKLERVERVELLPQNYTIPADFDAQATLADAWGIWYTENEPELVELKFERNVAGRIRETQWHRSEEITDQPDGSIIWRARIAEPKEMLPWIRGWGAECEVLEPEWLRDALVRETKRLMKIYGLKSQEQDPMLPFDDPARFLWAKTNRYRGKDLGQKYNTHPLICHLIDVAQMVCALWDHHLPQATRQYFSQTLDLSEAETRGWLAFFAGLHDLGKASPVFQQACRKEYPGVVQRLTDAGFGFEQAENIGHGIVSTWSLKTLFKQELGLDTETAHVLAAAIGGHHGAIITSGSLRQLGPRQRGKEMWDTTRLSLFHALAKTLGLSDLSQFAPPTEPQPLNIFTMALAGLVSFTDWLGSMSEYFSFAEPDVPLADYAESAYRQAKDALQTLGWLNWSPPAAGLPFNELFPFAPRPLQAEMAKLAAQPQMTPPALVIVEAPTGEGKTEAAWYLADRWLADYQQRGIYVAMPTQATSNQMLDRVKQFLEKRYPQQQIPLLLLHGDAIFSDEMQKMKMAAVGDETDKEDGTVVAHSWFLPKKRSLLAPFAVGTVDQSLLAVLQTRHFFVRLFGLGHKIVIFDEVHAYDTYMNTLLRRLLAWLRQMGTSVILLSATLPATTRQTLLEAYCGQAIEQTVSYPAITWAAPQPSGVAAGVIPLEASQARTVGLDWLAPDDLLKTIRQSVEAGGCVAVLCNTVNQAQQLCALVEQEKLVPDEDLILFHARFPFYRRQEIEQEVLRKFGKPDDDGKSPDRPQRAIVIATQVIEQSLDLDFDLMISFLAPVDLILQRAGRLHRHQRPNRPAALGTPRLLLVQPEQAEGLPDFGVDGLIYAPYILLRSFLALQNRTELHVPDDVQSLIEQVYSDDPLPGLSPAREAALADAKLKLDEEMLEQENIARQNLIYPPDNEDVFWETNKDLDEDNPELHQALRALTRLTNPTITLICLHQTAQGVSLDINGVVAIDLEVQPGYGLAKDLARRKVSLSNQKIVRHFAYQPVPSGWQKHPMLRYCRPVVFVKNVYVVNDKLRLRIDPKRGIIVEKEDL